MTATLEAYPAITGIGGCLGDIPLDTQGVAEKYGYDPEDGVVQRLASITGIEQRHHSSEHVLPSHLATVAGRQALESAGLTSDEIDYLNVSATLGDHVSPSVATILHGNLGLRRDVAGVFDATAACSGALTAYEAATDHMLARETTRAALIANTEMVSHGINPEDKRMITLFGDGSGAAVLGRTGANRPVFATLTSPDLEAIGVYAGVATGAEGMLDDRRYIQMDGRRVKNHAMELMPAAAIAAAREAGLWDEKTGQISDELGLFIPHQANYSMIGPLADSLGIPKEKRVETVQFHGNTSSASIPLALNHAYETGQLELDKPVRTLMVAIGAGMMAKAAVIDVNIASALADPGRVQFV